jgi:uncharacterized LabA/DUF88 family protein
MKLLYQNPTCSINANPSLRSDMKENSANIALFIDLDNFVGYCLGLGLPLDLSPEILRLKELGRITVRRSFGDIYKLPISEDKKQELRKMLQRNLIQHEDIPYQNSFKNSSDIRLVIDALSMALSSDILDVVAVVASDRDYLPLFAKLREIGKEIIGIGGNKDNTPALYIMACDYFYYHENLTGVNSDTGTCQTISKRIPKEHMELINAEQNDSLIATELNRDDAVKYLIDAIKTLESKGNNINSGASVIQMIQRLNPDFDFATYGFQTFKELCERARAANLIEIEHNGVIFNLKLRAGTEPSPVATIIAKDIDNSCESISAGIRKWFESKLNVLLPNEMEREMIYEELFNVNIDETEGIPLLELANKVKYKVSKSDVAKRASYKILYSLYRAGCFSCSQGDTPFNPIVHGLRVPRNEKQMLDKKFIENNIRLYIREYKTNPAPEVWSHLFFGSNLKTDLIKDITRSV